MNDYIVYCHENIINLKKYFGITKQSPDLRWGKNGNRYKSSPHFYSAIKKYGWNNFYHIILFNNLSEEMAKLIEIELIAKYETNNRCNGYNNTIGGDGVSGWAPTNEYINNIRERNSKCVLQIDMKTLSILNTYSSMLEAEKQSNILQKYISRCCNKQRKSAGGYYWMTYDEYNNYGFDLSLIINSSYKPVKCVESDIVFKTIKEASTLYKISSASIVNCCKGKTDNIKGLHWVYC